MSELERGCLGELECESGKGRCEDRLRCALSGPGELVLAMIRFGVVGECLEDGVSGKFAVAAAGLVGVNGGLANDRRIGDAFILAREEKGGSSSM